MNIVSFAPRQLQQDGTWQSCELDEMHATFAAELASGKASGWDVGATEVGDPQFYLLGSLPTEECILSISRLGRLYILEDGAGRVLFEHVSLESLTKRAKSLLRETKAGIVASAVLAWGTIRQQFEEKIEPVLAESEELLFHVAPQLAALA
jgi:hypothetical protein